MRFQNINDNTWQSCLAWYSSSIEQWPAKVAWPPAALECFLVVKGRSSRTEWCCPPQSGDPSLWCQIVLFQFTSGSWQWQYLLGSIHPSISIKKSSMLTCPTGKKLINIECVQTFLLMLSLSVFLMMVEKKKTDHVWHLDRSLPHSLIPYLFFFCRRFSNVRRDVFLNGVSFSISQGQSHQEVGSTN